MQKEFSKQLKENFPELYQHKFLIAISGGIDSVVLTHLCAYEKLDFALVHCNFQLRGVESDQDEEFVKELAKQLNRPFFVNRFETKSYVQPGASIQLVARELRYEWFEQLIKDTAYCYVLTAHHLQDQMESFFINLIRGTGLQGLTGIPEVNNFIRRPLLAFSLPTIENYARTRSLKWREDRSNASDNYIRNRIRHHLIPFLEKESHDFSKAFQLTQNHLNEGEQLLEEYTKELKIRFIQKKEEGYFIPVTKLKEQSHPRAILYRLLHPFGFTAWEDIYQLLQAQPGKIIYAPNYELLKDRESLIVREKKKVDKTEKYVAKDDRIITFSAGKLIFQNVMKVTRYETDKAYLATEKLKYPLYLRLWRPGDKFQPFGMKGHKKISDFLKDRKVSRFEKENTWVLVSDDQIVWVVGQQINHSFRVKNTTQQILKIELVK